MRVYVTADDIQYGTAGHAFACAVSYAVTRTLGVPVVILGRDVYGRPVRPRKKRGFKDGLTIQEGDELDRVAVLPGVAYWNACAYDAGLPIAPFDFTLWIQPKVRVFEWL